MADRSKGIAMRFSKALMCWFAAVVIVGSLLAAASRAAEEGEPHARAVAEEAAEQAAGGPNPLAVDPDLAIWTLVVFVILFVVLSKFAWPQIAAALDERERGIADNIAAAAAKNEEARRLLAAHEAKLAAAASEVRELLEEARRDAEQTKNRIVAEAKQAAQEESARAIREVEFAKDTAMQELAVTSANLAIDLAGKVVHEMLSKEKQAQLVREAIGKLAAVKPSKN
jgi:F-type H+-transporting ATPase subunit b